MSFSVCRVGCRCDQCQRLSLLQPQQNVLPLLNSYSDYYKFDYPPREMTAEDLGPFGVVDWHLYHWRQWELSQALPDAPYAFWLGAEAA